MSPVPRLERDRPAGSGARLLAPARAREQIRQRRVSLSELAVEHDGALCLLDRQREQLHVGMIAMARHLVQPEMGVRKAHIRRGEPGIQLNRTLEVLDGRLHLRTVHRFQLQPSFRKGAVRVEAGRLARPMRSGSRRLVANDVNGSHEPVPPLGDGLDVGGFRAVVAKRLPQVRNGLRERVLRDDHIGPQRLEQLFLGDERQGTAEEEHQQIDQLGGQRHVRVVSQQRERAGVERERTETVQHAVDYFRAGPARTPADVRRAPCESSRR